MIKLMSDLCFIILQNVLNYVIVNIDKAEDVLEDVRERALYRYLINFKLEMFDGYYSDIWMEYGILLIVENFLEFVRKVNVNVRTLYKFDLINW